MISGWSITTRTLTFARPSRSDLMPVTQSIIVAMTPDRVIGCRGRLPWRLSADLRRFKRLTMGHHVIMGRKTFESIGRLLPGRRMIVVSRQPDLVIPGARVAHSLSAAAACAAGDSELFYVGGERIYREALDVAHRIYLTLVHARIAGDAYFPQVDFDQWQVLEETHQEPDSRNQYATTYRVLVRERLGS